MPIFLNPLELRLSCSEHLPPPPQISSYPLILPFPSSSSQSFHFLSPTPSCNLPSPPLNLRSSKKFKCYVIQQTKLSLFLPFLKIKLICSFILLSFLDFFLLNHNNSTLTELGYLYWLEHWQTSFNENNEFPYFFNL